jgi:plasmid stabilization system protein ParE
MKITFDPAAVADLDDIFAWIEKENPCTAYDVIARI